MAYPSEGRGPYLHIEIAVEGMAPEVQTALLEAISREISVHNGAEFFSELENVKVVMNTVRNKTRREPRFTNEAKRKAGGAPDEKNSLVR